LLIEVFGKTLEENNEFGRLCLFFKRLLFNIAFFLVAFFNILYSFEIPDKPSGRVNDYANIFSQDFILSMENRLNNYDEKTGNEIVIVVIPSLDGENLESFSIKLAEKWKIGKKGKDNGVIILVAFEDRKIRIEVGYGLEDRLTDAISSIIIRNYIAPNFREGNYDKGILIAVDKIMSVLSDGGEEFLRENKDNLKTKNIIKFIYGLLIFFLFIILVDLIRYFAYLFSYQRGKYSFIEWLLIFSITFLILKLIFYSIFYGRRGYTGGSGGFYGGGFSGGGFSGGGGSFGGGGASGGW